MSNEHVLYENKRLTFAVSEQSCLLNVSMDYLDPDGDVTEGVTTPDLTPLEVVDIAIKMIEAAALYVDAEDGRKIAIKIRDLCRDLS